MNKKGEKKRRENGMENGVKVGRGVPKTKEIFTLKQQKQ